MPPAMTPPDRLLASTSRPVGDEIPCCPLYDFLFSNPLRQDSPIITRAPSAATRAHHIPIVPPEKPIFIDTDHGSIENPLTWLQLQRRSTAVGYQLNHQLGLSPSNLLSTTAADPLPRGSCGLLSPIVLLHLPNGTPFVTMLLGALAAGLTFTMVNPSYTRHELVHVLRSAQPALIVTSSFGLDVMLDALTLLREPHLRRQLMERIFIVDAPGSAPSRFFEDSHIYRTKAPNGEIATLTDWNALLQQPPSGTHYRPFQFSEPARESRLRIAAVTWSSGTSGKSKGVMCSHHAMVHSIISFWHQKLDYGPDERTIGLVPFWHVMGLQTIVLFSIVTGSTVYIMQKFEPHRYLEEITKNRITSLQIAPPIAAFLAKSPLLDDARYDLSSVTNSMSGGAPLAPAIVKTVFKRCGFLIKFGYGLSEAGHVANQLGATMSDLLPQLGTVGEVMYGLELKIISVRTKQLVLRNEEGEIIVRSPSLMSAYLDNPSETSQVLDEDGWLHTGDLGFLDDHGRLSITGRLKEIIMVKGYQVSPSDLEMLISKIDAVGEVAVTSFYCDDQATEFPRAYIVPQGDELVALCEIVNSNSSPCEPVHHPRYNDLTKLALQVKEFVESHMVQYKWLRGNIILTSHIPKSPSGKVLKRVLSTTPGVEIPLYTAPKSCHPSSKL
ncbi:hypothetical protein PTTG_05975 [Puccinia triticina 1-1 BBBD Race 1]|uniref:AMP-binding domain-containing protein n=2 Tax=Puccinia triticina TaxID=208348 RepID=A0A180GUL7_PUCT1|nr:uncharacterized protein PtA15_3A662 [Puccinia triticina]OAV96455.1 hypothetical protein PTTG_05975 [Puccinia triticina 1-1 BBBD Race 1]WAQ83293.1 hypothetical protein PtA15_3A662 [Puccinia triticina]